MNDNDDNSRLDISGWRQEGPQAISRGLAPDDDQPAVDDESLWLALNAWG